MKVEVVIILACITAVILVGGYMLYCVFLGDKSNKWPKTNAQILSCKVKYNSFRNDIKGSWTIRLLYTYKVDQAIYENSRILFGGKLVGVPSKQMLYIEDLFKKGAYIEIYYNPEQPRVSVITPGIHSYLKIGIAVVIFLLFFSISVLTKVL